MGTILRAPRLTSKSMVCALAFTLASLASAQASLQITSPADGTVVTPGQSLTVVVAASGQALSMVFVVGTDPIGFRPPLTVPPYKFTVQIPKNIASRFYLLSADGFIAPGQPATGSSITIDVERADSPVNLQVQDFDFPHFVMHVGDTAFSGIVGVFSDGTTTDVTDSTLTTFSSDNSSVATVDRTGLVKGVAPGFAKIIVTNGKARLEIPVTILRNDEN